MVHFRIRKAQERKATRAEKLAMKEQKISAQKIVRPETEANHIIKKQCQNIEENVYNVRTFT